MPLSIVFILLSIVLFVWSVAFVLVSYRNKSRALEAQKDLVTALRADYLGVLDRLTEHKVKLSNLRACLDNVGSAHRRATQHVAEHKRDALFYRKLFRVVATTLAQRNEELRETNHELEIWKEQVALLTKEKRKRIRNAIQS